MMIIFYYISCHKSVHFIAKLPHIRFLRIYRLVEMSAVGEKGTHASGIDICFSIKYVFTLKKNNNEKT